MNAPVFAARFAPKRPRHYARDRVAPTPLGERAYQGVLGQVVQHIAPHTEASPAGVLLQLLVMLGNLLGRTAHFMAGPDRHFCNLFVGIVGRSSRGRKGVSLGVARELLGPIDPPWLSDRWVTGLSSGEGLIWAVRDPIYRVKTTKRNGAVDQEEVLEDAGVSDKRLLVTETEFASVLQRMTRDGNTVSAQMRQAFDGGKLCALTKGASACATDPHISIIAHITRDELRRDLRTTETANGLANRFLWCYAERAQQLPDGGRLPDLAPYQTRLHEAVQFAQQAGEIVRAPDVRPLWHRAYARLTADHPGILGAVTSRAEVLVMRLACLYAIADCSHVVREPHLRAALEVWRYCRDSAAYIFGDALGDPVADDLLQMLRDAYPESLTRTEIAHGFGRNRSAADISRGVQLLKDAGLAASDQDGSKPGRPVIRVWYTPPSDADEIYDINETTPARAEQGTSRRPSSPP